MTYQCPVCGYSDLTDPPGPVGGVGGSYEICPSCGFQFGYTDDARGIDYSTWRKQWIDAGMPWDKGRSQPPIGWDPVAQLAGLPDDE